MRQLMVTSFSNRNFFMRSSFHLPFVVVICFLSMSMSGGDLLGQQLDWPQFRGPDANPVGDQLQLPSNWSMTDNLEWSLDIPGRGWSSPIVSNGKVFVTTVLSDKEMKPAQTGTTYSNDYVAELTALGITGEELMKMVQERDFEMPHEVNLNYALVCIDLESGKLEWQREYHQGKPPGGSHRKNSFSSETPVTDGEKVFVLAGNLGLYAFDFSGELVWKKNLSNHPVYLDFGTGSSPLLVDGKLIVLNDNEEASYLAAFRTSDGEEIWRAKRGDFAEGERPMQASSWTTPFLWKNSQRTEIVTIGPTRLTSYDLDGNELWFLKGLRMGPAASPFGVGDKLIVNGGAPQPMYVIRPGATGDITLKNDESTNEFIEWSRPRATSYIPTPLVYENGLYILNDNGIFTRLDLATGEESYKERIKTSGADFTSSPWAADGKIFVASEQGNVYVIRAGEKYELLETIKIGEMAMASPALLPKRLIFRTDKRVFSVKGS
jgi:outer membrane protein assembly factor BamB